MCNETAKKTLSQLGNSNPRPTVYEPVVNRNDSACLTSHNFQLWKVSNGPVAERPEKPAPATERDPAPPVEEPAPVSVEQAVRVAPVEQPIEVPDDAIELSTVRLFRADSDGNDGRKWDGARKWCTSAGMLYVATDGVLRVYGPGAWWGVAE